MKKGWLIGLIILGILIIGTIVYVSVNANSKIITGDAARKINLGRINVSLNDISVTPMKKSLGCMWRCIGHGGCYSSGRADWGDKYFICNDFSAGWF